ncbi:hypothetical protein SKAU_G00375650 [Synaphobranchus kaupii]|uniref:Uncharacterized protein n=1 Tax=Synaphobranchus kaupii TaxID=118154 RepID=A0A9Q1EGX4_SYNKA|nr:hypothetical protein SKAU_G00375650 [Synaphobranchus kaupii]
MSDRALKNWGIVGSGGSQGPSDDMINARVAVAARKSPPPPPSRAVALVLAALEHGGNGAVEQRHPVFQGQKVQPSGTGTAVPPPHAGPGQEKQPCPGTDRIRS